MVESKFAQLFKSRKFWVSVIAAVAALSAFALDEITVWQLIQALVATAAAYSTGIAIEDAGYAIGMSRK